ncbi:hypothetical protein [Chryseobacterium geocarposphaerae]|uniref:Membrane-bound lysozyme inhibitor of c-type lysozyme MliC n=1 Tax=Chryseobacterium geocarposphaerae TaxID=1416776 RepID=A0A2M9BYA1_9FLAO|nr:hypothetical protein [Chryseobacterium geocarposphaerae]PJJ63064.1 hypothetical protein CLV73_3582 [Chryseobacterium geocarposphaerae]
MKKKVLFSIFFILALTAISCKHSTKENEVVATKPSVEIAKDSITRATFVDDFGDQMEVMINHTQSTAKVFLNGKTYEIKKVDELPEYTAANEEYQYSDIHGNVTFLKKDADMVLFHYKKNKENGQTKMASY